jgi:hypothetical protein
MTDQPSVEPTRSRPPTNLRKHHQKTERNLILGGFAVLFVVGGGLVWYLYGFGAALTSWACLGSGVALFGVLYLILKLIELWVTRRG